MFRIMVTALILVLAFTFVACGGSGQQADQPDPDPGQQEPAPEPDPETGGDDPAPAGKKSYAIVYPVIHQFFDPVTQGAEAYAKELGDVELFIQAPEGGQVQQQIEIMENLISMKVDGI